MIFLDLSDLVSPYPMQVSNCIWDCLILVDSVHNFCNSYHAVTGFSVYGIRFFLLHKLFQSCYQGSCSVQGEVLGVGCFPVCTGIVSFFFTVVSCDGGGSSFSKVTTSSGGAAFSDDFLFLAVSDATISSLSTRINSISESAVAESAVAGSADGNINLFGEGSSVFALRLFATLSFSLHFCSTELRYLGVYNFSQR